MVYLASTPHRRYGIEPQAQKRHISPIHISRHMPHSPPSPVIHGTTVLSVRRNGRVVVAADGQVTFGNTV
ncbi:MAG: hypothetical protein ACREIP_16950, partial [Alphaproteobacteria bacterium]